MITQFEKKAFMGRKVRVQTFIAKKPSNLPDVYWNHATASTISGLEPGALSGFIKEFCGATSIMMSTRNTHNYNLDYAISSLQTLVVEAHPRNFQSLT